MRMWRIFALFVALAAILVLLSAPVFAQQPAPPKSPFGSAPGAERSIVRPRPGAEPAQPAGPLQRAQAWVLEKQAQFNRELAAAVRSLKTASPLSATLMLAALSFAYGVLHAAGPGHGKAVISSYVLADGRTVRRGILLAFLAALIQALSALLVVGVLVLLLRATGLQIRAMEAWLETASWALVALVGVWLLYYQLRSVFRPALAHAGHHHHHADPHLAHREGHAHSHEPHGHPHQHAHGHDDACEVCAHLPAAAELQGDWSWRRALALAFAVGVRPCTGAILVLVFAIGQGLLWAGVLSTFAMALGTAITVSVLAASAVGFRELAARLAGGSATSKWADRVQMAAGLVGASLVLVLGASFFVASLSATKPF
jgi:nickel/cobalt transporter (NicO) family protein